MGRAAAIAFAREGAGAAITHLPVEETDAREVIALIRQAGRMAERVWAFGTLIRASAT